MTISDMSVRRDRQLGAAWLPEMPSIGRRTGKTGAELLKAGICPICGAGPYTSPAGHATRAHGIDRFQLREMVGLLRREPICDPTHSAACRERAKARYERGELVLSNAGRHDKHTLSTRARALQKEKAAKVDRKKLGRIIAEGHARKTEERDAAIIDAYESGDTLASIASQFALAPSSVTAILRRRDIEIIDGRTRFHASRQGSDTPQAKAARAAYQSRMAAERQAIIEAHGRGVSVYDLAQELGTTPRQLRDRMARWGVKFPDGRSDPRRRKAQRPLT